MKQFCFLFFLLVSNLSAQKAFVLTYKYNIGDRVRVTTETYKNFSTKSKEYSRATYGETAMDLYEEITDHDGLAYEMQVQVELTRYVTDGQNLTYKLANLFKGDVFTFSFDRFGKITSEKIKYESDSTSKFRKNFDGKLTVFKNIFIPLPDYPVKVGDKWKISDYYETKKIIENFAADFGLEKPSLEGEIVLESVDDGVAKILLSVNVSGKGEIGNGEKKMSLDFIVKVSGDYYFNITDGKMVNGNLLTEVEGIGKVSEKEIEYSGSQTTGFNFEITK